LSSDPFDPAAPRTARGTSVLFVCMGNICRSPTAEGVFRATVAREWPQARLALDSAGTHDYHVGRPPDADAIAAAALRGYDISMLRARQVSTSDFTTYDFILAMDRRNLKALQAIGRSSQARHLGLFMDFSDGHRGFDVPDPYGGTPADFDRVLDMVEDASRGLLEHLRSAR